MARFYTKVHIHSICPRARGVASNRYFVAFKSIMLSCLWFMFIKMKFIHYHSYMMFTMKSMSIFHDLMNYDEIIL